MDHLKIRQIIADIDRRHAENNDQKRQEIAPWLLVLIALASGSTLFAAGAAFMKVCVSLGPC